MRLSVRLICQAYTLNQARTQLQKLPKNLPKQLEGTQKEREALVSLVEAYGKVSKQDKAVWRHLGRLAGVLTDQQQVLLPDSALVQLAQHSTAFIQASKQVAQRHG